jgi:hypothetical protein
MSIHISCAQEDAMKGCAKHTGRLLLAALVFLGLCLVGFIAILNSPQAKQSATATAVAAMTEAARPTATPTETPLPKTATAIAATDIARSTATAVARMTEAPNGTPRPTATLSVYERVQQIARNKFGNNLLQATV